MTLEKLIDELIQAAYDSGYCSGKGEDGQPHHVKIIAIRNAYRDQLKRRIAALRRRR